MKRLGSSELRALCIRNNWFTCGDIRQYTRFFQRNSEGATVKELSVIIWICSDEVPYNDIYTALCKAMDAMPKEEKQMICPGFRFLNEGEEYTIVLFYETGKSNVALLITPNPACPFVTVRDISKLHNGNCDWVWGHYFQSFDEAFEDFNERKNCLQNN